MSVAKRSLNTPTAWFIRLLVLSGAIALSVIGALVTLTQFPWLGPIGALAMMGIGTLVDYLFFEKVMLKLSKLFLVKGLFNNLKTKMMKQEYKHWQSKIKPENIPKEEATARFTTYFKQQRQKKFQRRFTVNRILYVIASLFAIITGIGWFAIIATEAFSLLGILSLGAPLVAPILGVALFVGCLQSLMFYHTLITAIRDNFVNKLWQAIKPKPLKIRQGENLGWIANALCNVAKWLLIGSLITLSVIGLTLTQSAYLESSFQLINMAVGQIDIVINMLVQTLMYGIILPVNIIFTLDHVTGAGQQIVTAVGMGLYELSHSSPADLCKHPLKTIVYGAIYTVIFGALTLHALTDAALTAVKGSVSTQLLPGKIFTKLAKWINIQPQYLAAIVATTKESAEHLDVIAVSSHDLVTSLTAAISKPAVKNLEAENTVDSSHVLCNRSNNLLQ